MCASAGNGRKILYVTGEESQRQLKLRAMRLGVDGENIYVLAETDIDSIIAAIDELKPDIAIIDSVQTVSDSGVASAPGSKRREPSADCHAPIAMRRMPSAWGDTICAFLPIHPLGLQWCSPYGGLVQEGDR